MAHNARIVVAVSLILAVAIFSELAGVQSANGSMSTNTFDRFVDAEGNIKRPENMLGDPNWVHIGSWAVVNDGGEGNGLHNVYTTKDVVQAYRKTGEFPDGAMLVKQVLSAETDALTTGQAYWAGEPGVWFVMIKDRQNRFPGNALWGNGWGWALFEAANPAKQVATNFRTDCLGCHIPAQQSDWVYIQGYRALTQSD
ncbi:MAG: cytochrome P460 family protein [Kordiimonadaceae bacterium]|nr:cytochrome P460 family protein [Kordiimonadaceae bacterium]MBO6567699.1 cytochrome P460 family protein [Kordiimonadaceae bacterium]MBO6963087.1 cytochrome P460 family protein [Kordiimonadaceae bacterium]